MIKINVSKDFTDAPGPRLKRQGKYSGEQFREDILLSAIEQAMIENEKVFIDLDGTFGYPVSFLDEAFGKLSRYYDKERILNVLELKCDDEPSLIAEIREYIEKGNDK